MPDFRSFCVAPGPQESEIVLSPEESLHLVSANRARLGDPVVAFDGSGAEWLCRLREADKRRAGLAIESRRTQARPKFAMALAQAMPKGKGVESIVRRATEFGTARIHPLYTERVEVRLDERREREKAAKWRSAAIEAAKQCGNPFLPQIEPPLSLERFLSEASGSYPEKLIASLEEGSASPSRLLERTKAEGEGCLDGAVWLVGPEGDFTREETARALACGFRPVTLGPLVLRCETAATAALAILQREILLCQAAEGQK